MIEAVGHILLAPFAILAIVVEGATHASRRGHTTANTQKPVQQRRFEPKIQIIIPDQPNSESLGVSTEISNDLPIDLIQEWKDNATLVSLNTIQYYHSLKNPTAWHHNVPYKSYLALILLPASIATVATIHMNELAAALIGLTSTVLLMVTIAFLYDTMREISAKKLMQKTDQIDANINTMGTEGARPMTLPRILSRKLLEKIANPYGDSTKEITLPQGTIQHEPRSYRSEQETLYVLPAGEQLNITLSNHSASASQGGMFSEQPGPGPSVDVDRCVNPNIC